MGTEIVKGYYKSRIDGEVFEGWEKEWREREFICPNCGWTGLGEDTEVSDITLGTISKVKCPRCKKDFLFPERDRERERNGKIFVSLGDGEVIKKTRKENHI